MLWYCRKSDPSLCEFAFILGFLHDCQSIALYPVLQHRRHLVREQAPDRTIIKPMALPLWPVDGISCNDIDQVAVPNVYWAATSHCNVLVALCAVARTGPDWLRSATRNLDNSGAEFNLFTPQNTHEDGKTDTAAKIYVTYQSHGSNNWHRIEQPIAQQGENATGSWWAYGFQEALEQLPTPSGESPEGNITVQDIQLLTILANRDSLHTVNGDFSDLYDIFQKAEASAVTIQTTSDADTLKKQHAYVALKAWEDNGRFKVKLQEPYSGEEKDYNISDIDGDIASAQHFKHWDHLFGPDQIFGAGEGGNCSCSAL
ncbi:hypothetical protein BD324DRAFT_655391 [Kockovaella imperatae]|uniref:Calpain catalytic domain-containing protein n=1 Tax=Kockovaella imperatae TaxID=4999 RepID=A0A1Y1UM50_9TREE|nr:hypothetical protein BD324DRAFT_655391 [Kockovaella imperatae]ORX39123.1 hypothetical protein BD324DRAFT_655391 [Kockovaella imperatae]